MNASGLSPLIKFGYENINHGLIYVFSERWQNETSNFHLPVGEMIVTLDDVACLLDYPITGRLIEEEEISYEQGIQLLEEELRFMKEEAMDEVKKQWGENVNYTKLKRCHERLLNRCSQFEEPTSDEEEEESHVRTACIKAFLLLLVGDNVFANKNSKSVSLVWLLAIQDIDRLGDWSWGGMTLTFLYSQLSLTSNANVKVVGGYMTLLNVIFFSYFLVDHKCIFVFMILVLI